MSENGHQPADSPGGLGGIEYIAEPLRSLAVPIGSLVLDAANTRTHDEANIEAIAGSLRRFGQRFPIVVQRQGMVVRAGNGRMLAAKRLGWSHVAALVVDESDVEATAFSIADNRTAELAGWDEAALARTLTALPVDMRIGWDEKALNELLARAAPEVVEDEVPEPLPEAVSRRGDLWTLGGHRLLCGDSTDGGDVALCMNGERADMCFTDPPYGVAYKAMRGGEDIANDETPEAAMAVTSDALRSVSDVEAVFTCCDWRSLPTIADAMQSVGIKPKACIVWDKMRGVQNLDRYYKRHEFILYAGPYGGEQTVDGDVWQFARDFDPEHPTPKPIALVAHAIETSHGHLVYDPFLGSGTTLIAAEQLNRRCYAIEIEPRYVDVAIRRWQKLTNKAATLDGKPWADVAAERGVPVGV